MAFICYECHKQTSCKWVWHAPPVAVITTRPYDGVEIEVYASAGSPRISFGRCEDCGNSRPCVDCKG